MRRVSMATRDELLAAVSERYRASTRADKKAIIDEFAASTGYHRKHVIRLFNATPVASGLGRASDLRVSGLYEDEIIVVELQLLVLALPLPKRQQRSRLPLLHFPALDLTREPCFVEVDSRAAAFIPGLPEHYVVTVDTHAGAGAAWRRGRGPRELRPLSSRDEDYSSLSSPSPA